ncbi:MAG: site-specific DNA-methyltransferase [Planctomycetaceae bacterium]|nr:site-specific DNA-methyltransferase [Planctomycetaceae bacterium]
MKSNRFEDLYKYESNNSPRCITQAHGDNFSLFHGDSVKVADGIPSNSIGLQLSSWPFSNQYGYSDQLSDMGTTKSEAHFFEQMDFLIPELLRVLIPGRLSVIHCKDRIIYGSKSKHGVFHLERFSDHVADAMEKHGFLFFGRVTISTDVVAENKSTHRLTQKEMRKDASKMGVGLPEYLMIFRKKPTEGTHSDEPVLVGEDDYYSVSQWQLDANSLWRSSGDRHLYPWESGGVYDYEAHIKHLQEHVHPRRGSGASMLEPVPVSDNRFIWANNEDYRRMNVLNGKTAATGVEKSSNHICPLQLDVIQRCITRWCNPGDVIWDYFNGIGSVTVKAIEMGRFGLGSELKGEYFNISVGHCHAQEAKMKIPTLFDMNGVG